MKLLYFTSGPRERIFDAVLAAGFEIEAVYATDPARWPKAAPTIERARSRGIPVRLVRKGDLKGLADEVRDKTCLSAGFAYLFPREILAAAHACLNVHGTLLPRYGGARTLNWVIEHGETESGVTVHLVDEGMDTGPILVQRSFSLSPFETGRSLARKTLEFEPAIVIEALTLFERQGSAAARPQDRAGVIAHPNRTPQHSEIDPRRPLLELVDQIRAADPDHYPAYFYLHGQKVCVSLWRPDKPAEEHDLL